MVRDKVFRGHLYRVTFGGSNAACDAPQTRPPPPTPSPTSPASPQFYLHEVCAPAFTGCPWEWDARSESVLRPSEVR